MTPDQAAALFLAAVLFLGMGVLCALAGGMEWLARHSRTFAEAIDEMVERVF